MDDASATIEGRRSFLHGRRKQTALDVLDGLKDFLDFRVSMDIIEKLSEFDEGSGKEDEDGD